MNYKVATIKEFHDFIKRSREDFDSSEIGLLKNMETWNVIVSSGGPHIPTQYEDKAYQSVIISPTAKITANNFELDDESPLFQFRIVKYVDEWFGVVLIIGTSCFGANPSSGLKLSISIKETDLSFFRDKQFTQSKKIEIFNALRQSLRLDDHRTATKFYICDQIAGVVEVISTWNENWIKGYLKGR